jgi:hypothetical protein
MISAASRIMSGSGFVGFILWIFGDGMILVSGCWQQATSDRSARTARLSLWTRRAGWEADPTQKNYRFVGAAFQPRSFLQQQGLIAAGKPLPHTNYPILYTLHLLRQVLTIPKFYPAPCALSSQPSAFYPLNFTTALPVSSNQRPAA